MNNDEFVKCFIASLNGSTYIIPENLRDKFEATDYYDRYKVFKMYMIEDDVIIEGIYIDESDLDYIKEGCY